MSKSALLFPMATMVLYVWVLGLLNFRTRVAAVKSGEVRLGHFRAFTQGAASDRVIVVGRHYDHQFQLPTWFLVTGATALAIDHVGPFIVGCAWAFIVARLLHSWIHLGGNHPLKRAGAFALGWFILALMWGDLVFRASRG